MENKYFVSYSPMWHTYNMFCIGENGRKRMQDIINAKHSDEIILETSYEFYNEIYEGVTFNYAI